MASALTLLVIVLLVITTNNGDSPPTAEPTSPTPADTTPVRPPASTPAAAVPHGTSPRPSAAPFATDARGFFNDDARCAPDQTAAAAGRTDGSLVVICAARDGRLEYRGVRLSLGAGVRIGDVVRNGDGFVARNEGTTYEVTARELVIRSADGSVTREPIVQYGPSPAVRPPLVPAAPPPPTPPVARSSSAPRAAPVPAPPPPADTSGTRMPTYPPLPLTARGNGNGIVRFTANAPWRVHYVVQCPPAVPVRGTINGGASYTRYHVDLRSGPDGRAEGVSPNVTQTGPIIVLVSLEDQRCGWTVSA